jgi:L-rhamnose mutarotase
MSKKYAWTWKVKPECLDEYVRMHLEPWQDVVDEHKKAGFRNYSIFQNDNRFFYVFETDDVNKAFAYLDKSEACQRWNAITSKMVEGSFDFSKEAPIEFMPEVFYIE